MLYRVTLTGADESIRPSDLIELSKEFPFVEWGILVGTSTGHRMPGVEWINELCEVRLSLNNEMNLALHVCGKHLRGIASGKPTLEQLLDYRVCCFGRFQLNWHGDPWPRDVSEAVLQSFCRMAGADFDPEIIFQLDGVNDHLMVGAMRRFRVSGLFDRSHGAGVLPTEWPSPRNEFCCGYAGGLGPDNVVEQLNAIQRAVQPDRPFWIDMETKLYTDGRFDLEKCRSVLSECAKFVEVGARI